MAKKRVKKNSVSFFVRSLKNPKKVGTITQSSRFLGKKVAKYVKGSEVVELGAGVGGHVTRKILEILPEDGHLYCFEIDSKFCEHLRKINDSRLIVINDDAKNLEQHVESCDCIVSGLPLTLMDKPKREKVLETASRLSKNYIQYQYSFSSEKLLKKYFNNVKRILEPRNIPPAFIYICSNNNLR